MVFVALLDVVGVSSVMPFLALLGDKNLIYESELLNKLYLYLNFEDSKYFLYFLGSTSMFIIIFSAIFKTFSYYLLFKFTNDKRNTFSTRLLNNLLKKPYVYFSDLNSSEITKNILYQTDLIVQEAIIPLLNIITYSLISILIIILFFVVNAKLALLAIFAFTIFYFSVYFIIRNKLSTVSIQRDEANKERFGIISEIFNGIKDVKVRNKEHHYSLKFATPSKKFADSYAQSMLLPQIPQYSMEAFLFCLILFVSLFFVGKSSDTMLNALPYIGVFTLGALRLKPAVSNIYFSYSVLNFVQPVLNKYVDYHKSEVDDSTDLQQTYSRLLFKDKICIKDLSFRYSRESPYILQNLNFEIQKNSVVGIIGETGCGKSTLVDILLGLYRPTEGEISLDNRVLNYKTMQSWRNIIGYVPQDINLNDDTIAQNIAYGIKPSDIDMSTVSEVAKIARIDAYIDNLILGYNTIVGERGVKLSGGQKQRIGIARALYHNPEILVLDEATSALDSDTEQAFIDALNTLIGSKTILMIAHRVSTLKQCNEIFEICNKKIKKIKKSGLFEKESIISL